MSQICIICRENTDTQPSIQLDCKCANSHYHNSCIENWLKTSQVKPQCLNCFKEINKSEFTNITNITNITNDKSILEYVQFFSYRINVINLSTYLVLNLFFNLSCIIFNQPNDLISQRINNIATCQFILSKIHLKVFIQLCTIVKRNNIYYISVRDHYKDFFHKYSMYINYYIGFSFILSIVSNLTIYLIESNLNKINFTFLALIFGAVCLTIGK